MLTAYPFLFMMKIVLFLVPVHSGWQGSFKEITKNAIEKIFEKTDNKNYSKINILFGIGISCKNYEVGEEFLLKI